MVAAVTAAAVLAAATMVAIANIAVVVIVSLEYNYMRWFHVTCDIVIIKSICGGCATARAALSKKRMDEG